MKFIDMTFELFISDYECSIVLITENDEAKSAL